MNLDGDKLLTGDKIYHITMGWGVVESLNHGDARIRMERGGGIVNMGENGYVRGVKVFYWFEPVSILPRKGMEAIYQEGVNIAMNAINMVAKTQG